MRAHFNLPGVTISGLLLSALFLRLAIWAFAPVPDSSCTQASLCGKSDASWPVVFAARRPPSHEQKNVQRRPESMISEKRHQKRQAEAIYAEGAEHPVAHVA